MATNLLLGAVTVAGVVGGFEFVDRTSLALIGYTARHRPLPSWAGASLGFVATSAIAVTIGAAVLAAIGPGRVDLVRVAGGVLLIGYAAWLATHPEDVDAAPVTSTHSILAGAFLLILLLELGDTTMILEILFVASFGAVLVFVAGALALIAVAAFAATLGARLGARLDPKALRGVVVAILALVGVGTLLYGLFPGAFASIGF